MLVVHDSADSGLLDHRCDQEEDQAGTELHVEGDRWYDDNG